MEHEKGLPESERRFALHPVDEPFREMMIKNFAVPYALYFVWAFSYYTMNFVVGAKKIRERQYLTLYTYFASMKWAGGILKARGPQWAPFVFMGFHFLFFSATHIVAIISFHSEIAHTISTLIWLNVCIWNGSCYYVRFFKYTTEKPQQAAEAPAESKKKN